MSSVCQKARRLKRAATIRDADDIDLGTFAESYPLIPAGKYPVIFMRAHPIPMGKGQRLVPYWEISELASQYHGTRLILSFAYPKNSKKTWGYLSKFAKCYRLAVERQPNRFDRLTPAIFKRTVFLAEVRTVMRDRKQVLRPESQHYSVIETLLEKLTKSGEAPQK